MMRVGDAHVAGKLSSAAAVACNIACLTALVAALRLAWGAVTA